MLEAQKQTYGDGLDPKFLHPYMWACKPHYYSTSLHFYNFPYAFGMLFALGVYARYREKGAAFLPEYDRLLASTGSASVRDAAASIGVDVTGRIVLGAVDPHAGSEARRARAARGRRAGS